MNKRDYYEILGVNKTANEKEIKKSFKKLAVKYHPDKQVGKSDEEKSKAEESFKEINEAYEVLSNPDKKKMYDQYGHDFNRINNQQGGFNQDDLNAFFNAHANMFDPFGRMKQQKVAPDPINMRINITTSDLYNGVEKKFKYKIKRVCSHCNGNKYVSSEGGKKETCKVCNGSGMITSVNGNRMFSQTCAACGGIGYNIINGCKHCNKTGYEIHEEEITVVIPKGAQNGMFLTYKESGNEMNINGKKKRGDLNVIINEVNDTPFIRENNDLHIKKEVCIYDCIIGGDVTIEGIDGKKYKLNIKQGTKVGTNLRMTGLGMPIMNTDKFGDLFVHIDHIMPKNLSKENIELLKKLKENEH